MQEIKTQQDAIVTIAMIFITALFLGGINILTVIPLSFAERAVFVRERAKLLYTVLPYVIAYTVAELPYLLISALCFINVFYWTLVSHHLFPFRCRCCNFNFVEDALKPATKRHVSSQRLVCPRVRRSNKCTMSL